MQFKLYASALALAAATCAPSAFAQTSEAPEAGAGEIVVTAQRRAQALQDVSASVTAVSAAALASAAQLSAATQSAPLQVAVIGPGGMGTGHLKLLAARQDVRIAYVCDVDANRLAAAAAHVEQSGGKAKPVKEEASA